MELKIVKENSSYKPKLSISIGIKFLINYLQILGFI